MSNLMNLMEILTSQIKTKTTQVRFSIRLTINTKQEILALADKFIFMGMKICLIRVLRMMLGAK